MVLFKNEQGQNDQVLIAIHHLVVDGVSWRILLEDLTTAYRQAFSGQTIRLPEKTASFALWSDGIRQYVEQHLGEAEKQYWQTAAAQSQKAAAVPIDHPRGRQSSG